MNASSRLQQTTTFETTTGASTSTFKGAMSMSSYGAVAYSEASFSYKGSKPYFINTHLSGNNDAVFPFQNYGMVDGGPTWDIDVHTSLNVNVASLGKNRQLISIYGKITGDAFPNAEAFVSDKNGKSVWLGIFNTGYTGVNAQLGPVLTLAGNINRSMMDIGTGIITDDDGDFLSIKVGNKSIGIDQFNADFSGPMSVSQFKSDYGSYYHMLFGNH